HEFDGHRAKLQRVRRLDQRAGARQARAAIDRRLYLRVQVIDPKGDAVEAQLKQLAHVRPVGGLRVDLDGKVIGDAARQIEMLTQAVHQTTQPGMTECGRRAAADVQLVDAL